VLNVCSNRRAIACPQAMEAFMATLGDGLGQALGR
jgi:hypothetical protein